MGREITQESFTSAGESAHRFSSSAPPPPRPALCEQETGNPSLNPFASDSWPEFGSLKINIFYTNGPGILYKPTTSSGAKLKKPPHC